MIEESEATAAQLFLEHLERLHLAIGLATGLVQNEDTWGETVESAFGLVKAHTRLLPQWHLGKYPGTYHVLDTLWGMDFRWLPPLENAREFMKVL